MMLVYQRVRCSPKRLPICQAGSGDEVEKSGARYRKRFAQPLGLGMEPQWKHGNNMGKQEVMGKHGNTKHLENVLGNIREAI